MLADRQTSVYHKEYGKGEILEKKDDQIYVAFGEKQRIFSYPKAFAKGYRWLLYKSNELSFGRWIMRQKTAHWSKHTYILKSDEYECSACNYRSTKPQKSCPNCGRKMKSSNYDRSWVDEMVFIDAIFDDD